MNRLAIIVLNWNGADDAIKCTESLLKQVDPVDIILVDNASKPESLQELEVYVSKKNNPQITLIKNSVNSGYSGGNNFGFHYALEKEYPFVGTLNPDAIADKYWTRELLSVLEEKQDIGIVAGILARSDKKHTDSTGDFYTTWGIPSPRGRDKPLSKAPRTGEYVFGVTGGGFITRSEVLKAIGMFDEKFFMYYEDVDFCFRAQLAGYKAYYSPKAIAYHKISASTNKVPGLAIQQTFKNLPLLFIKNVPLKLWWHILPRFSLTYTLIFGNAIIHGGGIPAFQGWVGSLRLTPHAWRERRKIQSNKKVSAQYINSIILHDIPPEQTGMRKFRSFFTGKK
tara:strand:- start:442 stop:1458 length:1017 start_codon:yes stop_codon:yes gene_type:complete